MAPNYCSQRRLKPLTSDQHTSFPTAKKLFLLSMPQKKRDIMPTAWFLVAQHRGKDTALKFNSSAMTNMCTLYFRLPCSKSYKVWSRCLFDRQAPPPGKSQPLSTTASVAGTIPGTASRVSQAVVRDHACPWSKLKCSASMSSSVDGGESMTSLWLRVRGRSLSKTNALVCRLAV